MMTSSTRTILAHSAIAFAICVGTWMLCVKPKVDSVRKDTQALDEMKGMATSALDQQIVADAANRMNDIRRRAAEIQAFNSVGSDTSRLYGLIMDLADAHGVRVQSLQPTAVKQSSDDAKVAITRIALSAQGEYDALGRFVEDVCELEAFVRPVSVDLTPSRMAGTTVVDVNLTCDFFKFTINPSLVSLGAEHAKP